MTVEPDGTVTATNWSDNFKDGTQTEPDKDLDAIRGTLESDFGVTLREVCPIGAALRLCG